MVRALKTEDDVCSLECKQEVLQLRAANPLKVSVCRYCMCAHFFVFKYFIDSFSPFQQDFSEGNLQSLILFTACSNKFVYLSFLE